MTVFHLAIPSHDLDLAEKFYTEAIGAQKARRYNDRLTLNFFDHQIVCHLSPEEIPTELKMYPRHFGINFATKAEFERQYEVCKSSNYQLFRERFSRMPGKPEQHDSFFIADPSNNLLEFKFYYDLKYIY